MAQSRTGRASRRLGAIRRFLLWLIVLVVLFSLSFIAGLWLAKWL